MRQRKIIKRDLTEEQFMVILGKVCQPVKKKPTESDSEQLQTSVARHSDGCSETHTHLDKTGDI